jgi:hypothetical protein
MCVVMRFVLTNDHTHFMILTNDHTHFMIISHLGVTFDCMICPPLTRSRTLTTLYFAELVTLLPFSTYCVPEEGGYHGCLLSSCDAGQMPPGQTCKVRWLASPA